MPREAIRPTNPNDVYQVHVGWQRDKCSVQIGVETLNGVTLAWQLFGSPQAKERIGLACKELFGKLDLDTSTNVGIAEALLNLFDVEGVAYKGIWADLDRGSCNDLIRIVRRARDQAYGRDE